MSLFSIFDVAGSGMSAQSIRLNTVASNMANAQTVSDTKAGAYRAKQPIFQALLTEAGRSQAGIQGVRVSGVTESNGAIEQRFMPEHPMADEQGYVYLPNVNMIEEMTNMISASRTFQSNVEVLNTSKELMLRTLSLGQ